MSRAWPRGDVGFECRMTGHRCWSRSRRGATAAARRGDTRRGGGPRVVDLCCRNSRLRFISNDVSRRIGRGARPELPSESLDVCLARVTALDGRWSRAVPGAPEVARRGLAALAMAVLIRLIYMNSSPFAPVYSPCRI